MIELLFTGGWEFWGGLGELLGTHWIFIFPRTFIIIIITKKRRKERDIHRAFFRNGLHQEFHFSLFIFLLRWLL